MVSVLGFENRIIGEEPMVKRVAKEGGLSRKLITLII